MFYNNSIKQIDVILILDHFLPYRALNSLFWRYVFKQYLFHFVLQNNTES